MITDFCICDHNSLTLSKPQRTKACLTSEAICGKLILGQNVSGLLTLSFTNRKLNMTRDQKNNDNLVRAFTCPKVGKPKYLGLKTREQIAALQASNTTGAAFWHQAK